MSKDKRHTDNKFMLSLQEKSIIWLNTFEGFYAGKQLQLLACFEDNAEKFTARLCKSYEDVQHLLDERLFQSMCKSLQNNGIEKAVDEALSYGTQVITIFSNNYPEILKNIANPPTVLYCLGDVNLLNTKSVAVVGSRKCSNYGIKVTDKFVPELARHGYAIISGMALGIDAAAHRAALKCGGKTVAVLGGGFSKIYPPQHGQLFAEIARQGLVVTEFAPKISSQPFHFPMRNRIVSGLADAVFMVEAGVKSGTFTTISHALEQGKEIFIAPGELFSSYAEGSNEMLRQMPHAFVTSPQDIITLLNGVWKPENAKLSASVQLSAEERTICKFLSAGIRNFDEILANIKISVPQLQTYLSKMEIAGIVEKQSGNYYKLILEDF